MRSLLLLFALVLTVGWGAPARAQDVAGFTPWPPLGPPLLSVEGRPRWSANGRVLEVSQPANAETIAVLLVPRDRGREPDLRIDRWMPGRSPDGRSTLHATMLGGRCRLELRSARRRHTLAEQEGPCASGWLGGMYSADGALVAVNGVVNEAQRRAALSCVNVFEVATGRPAGASCGRWEVPGREAPRGELLPDGRAVLWRLGSDRVELRELATEARLYEGPGLGVFSPSQRWRAEFPPALEGTAQALTALRLREVRTAQRWRVGNVPPGEQVAADFSPDESLLAVTVGATLTLWSLRTSEPVRVRSIALCAARELLFSPDGRTLAALCENGVHFVSVHAHTRRPR